MNSEHTDIDNWLINSDTINGVEPLDKWEPVFDPDRYIVYSKLGPFKRLFLRPKQFVKRFYQQVYSLPIEHWCITEQLELYDGFCSIDISLDICFQATLNYVLNNIDALSDINNHIKTTYQDLIINLLNNELLNLSDGIWIQKGVTDLENKIAFDISEMLIIQSIQSRVLCTMKPSFAEFPDVKLAQKNVYLSVLKKNFEVGQEKRQELFRQEQAIEQQSYEHQQKLLEQLKQETELERLKQAQHAYKNKLLLIEQEQQLAEQLEIEKRIHIEKIKHQNELKEIALQAEIQARQKHNAQLRIAERQEQDEVLLHRNKLKEKKLAADIAHYEKQKVEWLEAKNKIHQLQSISKTEQIVNKDQEPR